MKAVPISFTALMPCVNPIGTAIILSSLTAGSDPTTRKQLARRVAINAAALLIGSLLIGSHLLQFFGVSIPIVQAVGCVAVAITLSAHSQKGASSVPLSYKPVMSSEF